ncbi:hypothetical protein [Mediterraneibacter hominis]|nr:hypothetical protein [Mediterraneibacter hominis]
MMFRMNKVSFLVLKDLTGYATIEDVYERYSELTELKFFHNQYINKEFLQDKVRDESYDFRLNSE